MKRVTVIVPVKNSERTIARTVRALLEQDYPGPLEVLLVGDVGDRTWKAIREPIDRGAVRVVEVEVRSAGRDANAKRNAGLAVASGDVLALTDSDMVPPRDWVSTGVRLLKGHACVAGPMESVCDDFWGRYVDRNPLAGKTPRMREDYVTSGNAFDGARKPPITANVFFTRELHATVGGFDSSFVYSYEDYEWFQRVVDAGFSVLCTDRLRALHHHRQGVRQLVREYHRSGRGCAMFVRKHPHSSFGRNRLRLLALFLFALALGLTEALALALAGGATAAAIVPAQALLAVAGTVALSLRCMIRAGDLAAAAFPVATFAFGLAFSAGLVRGLVRPAGTQPPVVTQLPAPAAMSPVLEGAA